MGLFGEAESNSINNTNVNFEFDGKQFNIDMLEDKFLLMALLDLTKRARNGDKDLAGLLNQFQTSIRDADGNFYWPLNEK